MLDRFNNAMWYRKKDEHTHYSDLSLPRNHIVVVGHTPQTDINLQNLIGHTETPIIYCDCGKGNLQDFNLTTGKTEDIEMSDLQTQKSHAENRFNNLKIALGIINSTFHSIVNSVQERKPISQEDMNILWQNQNLLREDQQAKLSEILPTVNHLLQHNIKNDLKLKNFQQGNNATVQTQIPTYSLDPNQKSSSPNPSRNDPSTR